MEVIIMAELVGKKVDYSITYSFGEYKGNKMITLNGCGKPITFGQQKAKMLVANVELLKQFIEQK